MSELQLISRAAVTASTTRIAARVAVCVLLTVLDSGAVVAFGGTLYRTTINHPIWFTGIILLFMSLFGSLARAWFLALPVRSR
jgi:hypothetical protein